MFQAIRKLFSQTSDSSHTLPNSPQSTPASPIRITPSQVKEKLAAGEPVILVDVREPAEVEIASIPGARHIPMGEIPIRHTEITNHRDAEIVVFCHHGGRSERVMRQLTALGYTRVRNMIGGIDQWAVEVDPSLSRY